MNSVRRSRSWSRSLAAEDGPDVSPADIRPISRALGPGRLARRVSPGSPRPGRPGGRTAPRGPAGRIGRAVRSAPLRPGPCPLWMIATREQSFSTSCIEWVEKTIVLPWSRSSAIFLQDHRAGDQDVQPRGRLVEDQDRRVVDDRPGDRDLLLHAGRHLGAEDVAEVVHLEPVEDGFHPLSEVIGGHPVEPAEVFDQAPRRSSGRRSRCWPTCSRYLARTASGCVATSKPATHRPAAGRSRRTVLKIRSVVVLPAPFGPSRPKIAPGWQSKLTSTTAGTQPRR